MPAPDARDTPPLRPAPELCVLVPAYNEQDAISQTVRQLAEVLSPGPSFELIVINDGSTDATAERLQQVADDVAALRIIDHPTNVGYGASLKTGIRRARAPVIAIIDADGTYPIERLGELVGILNDSGADMVVGARTGDDVSYPLIRKIPKVFLKAYASWLARTRIPDLNSGMRVFRKEVAERFLNIFPNGFSFTTTITVAMLANYYDVRFVPIGYKQRVGRSKIQPIRDTLRFVQLIARTGMYFAPLRVLLPVALLLLLGAAASLSYDLFVLHDLTEKTLILSLFGLNTIMFGLLADMIDKRSK